MTERSGSLGCCFGAQFFRMLILESCTVNHILFSFVLLEQCGSSFSGKIFVYFVKRNSFFLIERCLRYVCPNAVTVREILKERSLFLYDKMYRGIDLSVKCVRGYIKNNLGLY
eukprot:TRINITY_DN7771_c0_g2_i1.p5 TRINITY_DN7771_c0_g2~~TRINITY_DN7771_c0_g2_i1.p5  ORF type:complete len:113 (-),score=1.10 TRINITY_DN7771_c0_g2_i1:140-478(-)